MAAVDIGARDGFSAPTDDSDDLFDYDAGDVFRDVDTNMDAPTRGKSATNPDGKKNGASLGIDEEIKVIKKRAPIPKLDETRLLSPAGISKLRRITKERMRFKGRGHEYSDVARLLNAYQLWLDDLFPRAKFTDALSMIEKLGHTKRMQTMRKEWIRESKPQEILEASESTKQKADDRGQSPRAVQDKLPTVALLEVPRTPTHIYAIDDEDDDINAAIPRLAKEGDKAKRTNASKDSLFVSDDEEVVGGQPLDDDLDALLAEDQTERAKPALSLKQAPLSSQMKDKFEDDMEAMAGLDDMW